MEEIVEKLLKGIELTDEDIKKMNEQINRYLARIRYLFYIKFYGKVGIQESNRGFG